MQLFSFTLARFRSFAAFLILLTFSALLGAQQIPFGGIELASTSIKGLTFVFQPGAEGTGTGAARPERMLRLQYAERNTNFISMRDGCKLSAKGLDLVVKNTNEVVAELKEGARAKKLGDLQLYGVASSGLAAVCNRDEIRSRVQAATGLCVDFISASDESRYSLGFVLPRDRYRSLIVDIGGGNTKMGYYVVTKGAAWPPHEWHGMELEYGARTLKDKALALMKAPRTDGKPAPDFYAAVAEVLQNDVGPRLDELKLANSAFENFSTVYMVGGTIWATSVRTHPVQQEEWAITSLSPADFTAVQEHARDNTLGDYASSDFGPKVSAKTREDADNDLRDVLQRFDPESLYAGASLARFIIEATTPHARLYFPTTAAWISGYAREKFRETGRSVPSCSVSAPAAAKASTEPANP